MPKEYLTLFYHEYDCFSTSNAQVHRPGLCFSEENLAPLQRTGI